MNMMHSSIILGTKLAMLGLLLAACSAGIANVSPAANPSPSVKSSEASQQSGQPSTTTNVLGTPTPQVARAAPRTVVNASPVQPPPSGPRLQAKIESVDYGEVQDEDIVDQIFEFTNVGTEPLVMNNIDINVVEGC